MKKLLKLECVFCGSTNFELPNSDYKPKEGDMIKCHNCGKLNDYSSLMEVVKGKATQLAQEEVKRILKKHGFK